MTENRTERNYFIQIHLNNPADKIFKSQFRVLCDAENSADESHKIGSRKSRDK